MKILGGSLKKFDDRKKTKVFIRYKRGSKGYRACDLIDGRIHLTNNVIFYEERC